MEKTTPKKFCFVLMPFDSKFDDIYQLGIKSVCEELNVYCERVDEQDFTGSILERIYNQISKADFIIADMTNRNPNVFYEVGYAHALGKLAILMTQNSADIPFDLKHYPHLIYRGKILELKEQLTKKIKWIQSEKETPNLDSLVDLDIYSGKSSLSKSDLVLEFLDNFHINIDLTIFNNSYKSLKSNEFNIGIITTEYFSGLSYELGSEKVKLPDGRTLFALNPRGLTLYPSSYTKLEFNLHRNDFTTLSKKQEIIVRIYSDIGFRDYPLTIKTKINPNKII